MSGARNSWLVQPANPHLNVLLTSNEIVWDYIILEVWIVDEETPHSTT